MSDILDLNVDLPWTKSDGSEADIVLATRIRLARNIKGCLMPQKFDAEHGGRVLNQCRGALAKCENPRFEIVKMDELTPLQRGVLVEKHFVSPAFMEPSAYAAAAVSEDKEICVMINEEDHLRIQCLLPGLKLQEAWQKASALDDKLEREIDYAFDSEFGYLTACPTNLGTGLRASVMVHLPALNISGKTKSIFNNLARMGMTVRGMYGEGSEIAGNLYQISNQMTLGLSEQEIIENMNNVILQIVEAEREARKNLRKQNESDLEDNVWRAYAMLAHSRKMTISEMMARLSYLRLGVDLGIIEKITPAQITQIMIKGQTAYIQQAAARPLNETEIDCQRASMLREALPLLQ